MRPFRVVPGQPAEWPDMPSVVLPVTRFLATVRVTGDRAAAAQLMAVRVRCHQVISEENLTIDRIPYDYADHVAELLAQLTAVDFSVEELLAGGDRVYLRWRQEGTQVACIDGHPPTGERLVEVGSAVYRVAAKRIVEYWIQLDRAEHATLLARHRFDGRSTAACLPPNPASAGRRSAPTRGPART